MLAQRNLLIEIKEINLQLVLEMQGITSRMRPYRLQKINVWGKILLVLTKFPPLLITKGSRTCSFFQSVFLQHLLIELLYQKKKPNKQTRKDSN